MKSIFDKRLIIGICLIAIVAMVFFLYAEFRARLTFVETDEFRECSLNRVAIGSTVEHVIKEFGSNYLQEIRSIEREDINDIEYMVFVYEDALVYLNDGLVEAIQVLTPLNPSPRGPKVGDTRERVERTYWKPSEVSDIDEYVFLFTNRLVFRFVDDIITEILLIP